MSGLSYLHRLDVTGDRAQFVATSSDRLRGTPFLDGRERFWDAEAWHPLPGNEPPATDPDIRYIFHVSFCGSTLLASLLDQPGTVLALKEPQALVDLSDRLSAAPNDAAQVARHLSIIERHLLKPVPENETIVAKPSNWANNLVPHLCRPTRRRRAVFVSMPRHDFVTAVFRGGRDRIAYTARAAAHLAANDPAYERALAAAIGGTRDPLDQVARIAALAHRIQEKIFADAIRHNRWTDQCRVTLDNLLADPVGTTARVADVLGFTLDPARLETIARKGRTRHAKSTGVTFSRDDRAAEDRAVDSHHGTRIRHAVDWADRIDL